MEEVIIDGVDVSKCKHITKAREVGDQHCALYDYKYCIGKMCYYKQLKRLEQENEKLKESLKIASGLCKTLEDAKANEHNQWFTRCCEINNECDTYRSALKEIKEIVKSVKTEYEKVKDNPLALYHTEINGAYSVAKSILSKISEVENER